MQYPSKQIFRVIGLIPITVLLLACKDNGKDYPSTQNWIYETMQDYYLFYQDIPSRSELDFTLPANDFLKSALSDKDQKNGTYFSHIEPYSNTASHRTLSTYPCFGFETITLVDQAQKYFLRVLYVYPNSPASRVGLKRGDWIIAANGQDLTHDAYQRYVQQPQGSCSFTIAEFKGNRFIPIDTIQMPVPSYVEQPSILINNTISSGNRRAAYIMYNAFEEDVSAFQLLFKGIAAQGVDDIILDLRYNPGGYVNTAIALCSHLVPSSHMGETCLKMTYNDKVNQTQTYTFDTKYLGNPAPQLQYENLYVIATEFSASASEIIINCLRPYMQGKFFHVGNHTYGKNLAQSGLMDQGKAPGIKLWLTTSRLSNAQGFGDYFSNGLQPDYKIPENYSAQLGELGTQADPLLAAVLRHMETGSFSDPSVSTASLSCYPSHLRIVDCSLNEKPRTAMLP